MMKPVFYLCLAITALLFLYWLKNLLGINLLTNLSVSAYPPFKQLLIDTTLHPAPGELILDENFESPLPSSITWLNLTAPNLDAITATYEQDPARSRHLVVTNNSERWWHITHRYRVAAQPGDRFHIKAHLWSDSAGGHAGIQVGTMANEGHIIRRNTWRAESEIQGKFQQVQQEITVTPGTHFLQFRLAGHGRGIFKFDNIQFIKMENSRQE